MALLPRFEQAFVSYMQDRTIDGPPRTSRRYSTYDTCLLPTMADKLLFILTYLRQNPIQEIQGQLFGMSQSNAHKWIHLLHPKRPWFALRYVPFFELRPLLEPPLLDDRFIALGCVLARQLGRPVEAP